MKKSKRPLFWLLLLIIIVILLVFVGKKLIGSKSQKQEASQTTPTPTQTQLPTDTPSLSPTSQSTPSPKPTNTPTPKQAASPLDKTTGLDRSKLSVAVQNGSGETGVAAKASDFLKNLGYNVVSTGNADNSGYTSVTVQVKNAKSDYLSLLKKDLSANYTVGASSSDLSASTSADAVVIIGK
ncbi:LytR C-terminal domain-containing protein [Patescibacteria group bacterium]|nr:LytR C-terminal domain-containing protein [Patescibacteria group bacterium]